MPHAPCAKAGSWPSRPRPSTVWAPMPPMAARWPRSMPQRDAPPSIRSSCMSPPPTRRSAWDTSPTPHVAWPLRSGRDRSPSSCPARPIARCRCLPRAPSTPLRSVCRPIRSRWRCCRATGRPVVAPAPTRPGVSAPRRPSMCAGTSAARLPCCWMAGAAASASNRASSASLTTDRSF